MTAPSGSVPEPAERDWSDTTDTDSRYEQRGRSCTFCLALAAGPHVWPTDHAPDCPRFTPPTSPVPAPTEPKENSVNTRKRSVQVSDLDRCLHGRHVADDCVYCLELGSHNLGNPHLDDVIGQALDGRTFTVRDLLATIDRTGERQCTWQQDGQRCVRPLGHRWAHMDKGAAETFGAYTVVDAKDDTRG